MSYTQKLRLPRANWFKYLRQCLLVMSARYYNTVFLFNNTNKVERIQKRNFSYYNLWVVR